MLLIKTQIIDLLDLVLPVYINVGWSMPDTGIH
jgi:hypothetical protein